MASAIDKYLKPGTEVDEVFSKGCLNLTAAPKNLGISGRKTVLLDGNPLEKFNGRMDMTSIICLSLNNTKLKRLPDDLFLAKNLKALRVNCNQLGLLDEKIGFLENLEILDIENIGLTKLPPAICKLKKLQVLNLSGNQLEEFPEEVLKLENLRELRLTRNKIKRLPDDLSGLKQLQKFYLSWNCLEELPQSIEQLSNLEELYVSNNSLKSLPGVLGRLPKLEEVIASDNPITSISREIAQSKILKKLHLEKTLLSFIPIELKRQGLSVNTNFNKKMEIFDPQQEVPQPSYPFPSLVQLASCTVVNHPEILNRKIKLPTELYEAVTQNIGDCSICHLKEEEKYMGKKFKGFSDGCRTIPYMITLCHKCILKNEPLKPVEH